MIAAFAAGVLALMGGCDRATPGPAAGSSGGSPAEAHGPSNRVDINAAVRQNLGLTFARVERRNVARTLRIPGRFELLPTARREYRAIEAGVVELLVEQYQSVAAGTPLYRLDSPRWREMQRELADAEAAVRLAQAGAESIAPLLASHESHHAELQKAVDLWTARVATLEQLAAAGGARGEELSTARSAMASSRAQLAETLEKEAELLARRSETAARLDAAVSRLAFLTEAAATLAGVSVAELRSPAGDGGGLPRWRTLNAIEVRALSPGVVESVHAVAGGVVERHGPVLSTVRPGEVRFRAVGLQSDLPRLADGQPAEVVPAEGAPAAGSDGAAARFAGVLTIAPTADPARRTVEVMLASSPGAPRPAWAKAGVAAFLEVVTDGGGGEELAIPLRCVARDGTTAVIFRRDPADPDKAIRVEADLGVDDGRWVVIRSGVGEGNEIVLDGVFQLMVATSGTVAKGGHFHPDGTFHEDGE